MFCVYEEMAQDDTVTDLPKALKRDSIYNIDVLI